MNAETIEPSGPFLVERIREDGAREQWGWFASRKAAATEAARLALAGLAAEICEPAPAANLGETTQ